MPSSSKATTWPATTMGIGLSAISSSDRGIVSEMVASRNSAAAKLSSGSRSSVSVSSALSLSHGGSGILTTARGWILPRKRFSVSSATAKVPAIWPLENVSTSSVGSRRAGRAKAKPICRAAIRAGQSWPSSGWGVRGRLAQCQRADIPRLSPAKPRSSERQGHRRSGRRIPTLVEGLNSQAHRSRKILGLGVATRCKTSGPPERCKHRVEIDRKGCFSRHRF